jgi:hypothetical protein
VAHGLNSQISHLAISDTEIHAIPAGQVSPRLWKKLSCAQITQSRKPALCAPRCPAVTASRLTNASHTGTGHSVFEYRILVSVHTCRLTNACAFACVHVFMHVYVCLCVCVDRYERKHDVGRHADNEKEHLARAPMFAFSAEGTRR